MHSDYFQLANTVHDEASFLLFVEALRDDWNSEQTVERENPSSPYGAGARGWENGTIGTFLDALVTWGRESASDSPDNPWCRAAQLLAAGKHYE
jgi:hypothetical protein